MNLLLAAGGVGAALAVLALTGRKLVLGNNGPMIVAIAGNGQYLRPDVAEAFKAMAQQAGNEGVRLQVGSGFRSVAEQAVLYAQYARRFFAPPRVAKPGTSNHGKGIAVDVADGQGRTITYGSPEFHWLTAYAAAYGFGWTEGRTVDEPWHWVYEA